jgi:hypothetical protein
MVAFTGSKFGELFFPLYLLVMLPVAGVGTVSCMQGVRSKRITAEQACFSYLYITAHVCLLMSGHDYM